MLRVRKRTLAFRYEVGFPLTPALSPAERENCFQPHRKSKPAFYSIIIRVFESRQKLFPLPGGEGQGEGWRNVD